MNRGRKFRLRSRTATRDIADTCQLAAADYDLVHSEVEQTAVDLRLEFIPPFIAAHHYSLANFGPKQELFTRMFAMSLLQSN
jgi:hypothetical protein